MESTRTNPYQMFQFSQRDKKKLKAIIEVLTSNLIKELQQAGEQNLNRNEIEQFVLDNLIPRLEKTGYLDQILQKMNTSYVGSLLNKTYQFCERSTTLHHSWLEALGTTKEELINILSSLQENVQIREELSAEIQSAFSQLNIHPAASFDDKEVYLEYLKQLNHIQPGYISALIYAAHQKINLLIWEKFDQQDNSPELRIIAHSSLNEENFMVHLLADKGQFSILVPLETELIEHIKPSTSTGYKVP